MENYEQKHKEDLEGAKGWLAIAKENDNKIAIQILENLFPELKESEDEKIRKSLIRNFTNQHSSNFPTVDGFTREQILAWFEKQKCLTTDEDHHVCKDGRVYDYETEELLEGGEK